MRNQHLAAIVGGVLFCVLAQPAFAQTARTPVFVSPEQLDVAAVLPSPPAGNSPEAKAEMAELHRLQESRSRSQIEHAKADEGEEDIFIFKDVVGEKFRREAFPLTAALSDHVHNDGSFIVNPAKTYFHRPRPYQFDTTLKPVCKTTASTTDYAYPSGHATTGYLEALVLTLMVPEKRDAILARADDYAHSRLVCGVHYPTDTLSGKDVAYAMIGIMMGNPQFKKELEAAKAEIRVAFGQ